MFTIKKYVVVDSLEEAYKLNKSISHNVKSITLEVKETNIKAIHLYEKFDFSKVAVRRKYYQGIDGILMEKELM